ncbi:hypothetical protein MAHJHV29_49610 [Mycobacterium avium subsp. hominissuis]
MASRSRACNSSAQVPGSITSSKLQSTSTAALSTDGDGQFGPADVAIIDARSNVAAAQAVSHRLTADHPATSATTAVAG